MEEFGDFQQFEEINPLVLKFESMLLKGENPFFDVEEYEEIIEHYIISNLDHAEMVVDYALSQYPWNTFIMLKKAIVAAHRGNSDEAFEIMDRVKHIDSNNMDFFVTKSYIHRILGDYKKSIQSLIHSLKFNEDVEEVYFDIAEDYSLLGNINQEIHYLKKCLEIKPDYTDAIEKLFWAFKTQENFQQSVDYFQNLTQIKPLQQNAWEKLGFSYYELGLYEKSIEAFEYSLSISNKATSFTGIAHSYWKLDLHFQAIAILNEAIEKNPFTLDINTLIGWIYIDISDYANAQKYFLNEIFLNATSGEAWKGLAQTYIYFNDYNNAFSCISKSLLQSDNDLDSLLQLAYIAEQIDLPAEEINQIYNIAIDKFPDNENVYIDYSSYLFSESHSQKAIDILKSALDLVKNKAPIFYRLAALHYLTLNDTMGHLYLISGLESNKSLINLMYEFDSSLEINKTITDIVDSYINNNDVDEDI